MGKLVGSILILTGCLVLLFRWMENMKQRQCMLHEIIRFFHSWEYALETKKMRVMDFFDSYSYAQIVLQKVTHDVRDELYLHTYPTGQTVWQKILEQHKDKIHVPEEAYQILLRAGDSFFGTNRAEAMQCIRACIRQMEAVIEEERKSYREKRKVYMPVGMLTGVMLVILLL